MNLMSSNDFNDFNRVIIQSWVIVNGWDKVNTITWVVTGEVLALYSLHHRSVLAQLSCSALHLLTQNRSLLLPLTATLYHRICFPFKISILPRLPDLMISDNISPNPGHFIIIVLDQC